MDCHQHHDGEEQIIFRRKQLLERFPNLLLILVPRHPGASATPARWCRKRNELHPAQHRRNPVEQYQVVIGDTMGELMLLYGIADLAFVGGSLGGGHNPLEPPPMRYRY